MSANVFLNLLKRVSRNEFIKLKNTGARMLVSMYHRTLKIRWNYIFGVVAIYMQRCYGRRFITLTISGLLILMHEVISLSGATYDK